MIHPIAVAAVSAAALSLVATGLARPALRRSGVVDESSERSAHRGTAIRGAGIGPAVALVLAVVVLAGVSVGLAPETVIVVASALAFAGLGLGDDIAGLPVVLRLTTQVGIALAVMAITVVVGSVPWWLAILGAALIVGVVNAVNFMDGVDGVSSLFALIAGAGFAVIGSVTGAEWLAVVGALTAGIFAGFLPWNLLRRGTFLGDAGSYLLGGLIGTAVVLGAAAGVPLVALGSVVVVYLADTAYTLIRRIREGKRWTESHREHLYQRLGFERLGHVPAALLVAGATFVCVTAGILTLEPVGLPPILAVAVFAIVAVGYVLLSLRLLRGRSAAAP